MILGIEIALTVFGLLYLIRGRGVGKDAVSHVQYRFLGAFMLTVLPVAFAVAIVFAVVWVMKNPDADQEAIEKDIRWPIMGIEVGIVLLYALIATLWDKAIRRKVARDNA